MKTRFSPTLSLLAASLLLAAVGSAQEAESSERTTLRVELVFSKLQGERVTARLPYSFIVTAGGVPEPTTFRMGIEVPVTVDGEGRKQYRNVGTNIDCAARRLSEGRFEITVTFEQSSTYPTEPVAAGGGGDPLFRTFSSNFRVALEDGDTVELTSATDPVTGEVSKVDVSLSVLK